MVQELSYTEWRSRTAIFSKRRKIGSSFARTPGDDASQLLFISSTGGSTTSLIVGLNLLKEKITRQCLFTAF